MNSTCAHIPIRSLLPLLVLLGISGCAGMGGGYETPTVTVQSFRPVASGDASGLPQFEIVLHVVNPNLKPLELAGVSYTISLNGHDLIKGVSNELPVIEGYGEGSVTLRAGFNLFAGIQLFRSLMQQETDTFDYRFEAKLDPGAFRPKIRISDTGSISLSTRQSR